MSLRRRSQEPLEPSITRHGPMPSRRSDRPPPPRRTSGPRRRSAREIALAEWRGADWSDAEVAMASGVRPLDRVVATVSEELGLGRQQMHLEIVKVWNGVLDPNVVAHARPTGLRHGTLFVSVDNHVWLAEIVRYRRREILERLQHSFGPELIRRVSFRAG